MDLPLLVAGLIRALIWGYGFHVAFFRRKSRSAQVGFGSIALLSGFFAFANAGAHMPDWIFKVNAFLSTPAAALIVAAYISKDA
jgi:hypothetical protein